MPKLLAIDDEQEFTNLMQNYFGPRGFQVLVAHAGDDGLRLAQKEKPEICIIDLKMPGMHGDEVLKKIKETLPNTKCIMVTASEGEGKTRAHLLEMGACDCFEKPLSSISDLEQTIKEGLDS